METNSKYPRGIFINKPRDGAPEFVRGSISIKSEDAVAWIKENTNDKGYVNIDILNGKDGLYLKHNDWKPAEKEDGIKPEDLPAF